MNVDVGRLARQSAHGRLVDQDAGIGQREALFGLACRKQQCRHGGRLADANRGDVVLYVLHRVVDGHARRDRSARRVDVELDVLFRVFLRQEQHLRDHQVGDGVINGSANEDDIVAEQAGINVIGAFASPGRFDHHRYQHHLSFLGTGIGVHVHPFHTPAQRPWSSLRGGSKWSAS